MTEYQKLQQKQADDKDARKASFKTDVRRMILILVSAVIMALNINTFVHTGGLYPGGATGLTVLIQRVAEMYLHIQLPYTVINVILNAVPFYIGLRYVGKKFAMFSLVCIMATNFLVDLLPSYVVTYDTLLISIFGGILYGAATGLCLLVNTSSGGTDFISIYLSQKKGMDTFNIIFAINACILLAGGILFGWDKALYSIIFQYASTQLLHVMYKKYQQNTLFIITDKPSEITEMIYSLTHHGATIINGEGAYEHSERHIVYSIVSSAESKKVAEHVKEIDEKAFVNVFKTERVLGSFYQIPNE